MYLILVDGNPDTLELIDSTLDASEMVEQAQRVLKESVDAGFVDKDVDDVEIEVFSIVRTFKGKTTFTLEDISP